MTPTFPQEFATQVGQVSNKFLALHRVTVTSEKSFSAAFNASFRLKSRASFNVIRRLSSNSSFVRSWQFTPGISWIHPIHHPSSCFTTALYVFCMFTPVSSEPSFIIGRGSKSSLCVLCYPFLLILQSIFASLLSVVFHPSLRYCLPQPG